MRLHKSYWISAHINALQHSLLLPYSYFIEVINWTHHQHNTLQHLHNTISVISVLLSPYALQIYLRLIFSFTSINSHNSRIIRLVRWMDDDYYYDFPIWEYCFCGRLLVAFVFPLTSAQQRGHRRLCSCVMIFFSRSKVGKRQASVCVCVKRQTS